MTTRSDARYHAINTRRRQKQSATQARNYIDSEKAFVVFHAE